MASYFLNALKADHILCVILLGKKWTFCIFLTVLVHSWSDTLYIIYFLICIKCSTPVNIMCKTRRLIKKKQFQFKYVDFEERTHKYKHDNPCEKQVDVYIVYQSCSSFCLIFIKRVILNIGLFFIGILFINLGFQLPDDVVPFDKHYVFAVVVTWDSGTAA